MVAHRELLEAIAARAGLDRPDAARQPAESVLVGVARRLDGPDRARLGSTLPSHLAELVRASAGVTYWATDAKARAELGYAPRDLETGLRDSWVEEAGGRRH